MTYPEFVEETKKIQFWEKRVDSPNLQEFVISQENLKIFTPVLESYFGPPLKPAGQNPSREATAYSAPYGGIQKNQTLYFRDSGEFAHCVMLWPWSDGKLVTVKMTQVPKKK